MILFTREDRQMLAHIVDVIGDRLLAEDGYTDQDRATVDKLEALSKQEGSSPVLTGDVDYDRRDVFRAVLEAELDNWVPGASQRLLYRVGFALGFWQLDPSRALSDDCGDKMLDHLLKGEVVADLPLNRCTECLRLFRL